MNVELLDRKQRQLEAHKSVSAKAIHQILTNLSAEKDYTLVIEHKSGALMYIAVDHGLQTLFIELGEDEFYDYISSPASLGEIEFIQGGQLVKIDKKYLAPQDAVKKAIENFASDPNWVKENIHWQLQI